MDALIKFFISVFEWSGANKDFIVLLGIFGVGIKHFFLTKIQQEKCMGRFSLQDYKIQETEKRVVKSELQSIEALEIVRRVETCSETIQQTVKDIKIGYQEFMNKHGKEIDAEKS